ncbi:hypothetical protein KP509_03G079400 [Ceratopteris richardii]|uniref:Bifunctional inhibitor/plant lipid transfer protein/seed storage helical domain-containing protein n=1 Tax=Ceratopteris richardii TaxID=49495 RepID=A0A8T2VCW1_CERRI|nr:hypothetical protein KP509_03G079400 [Ceratopteris richardii]
MKENYGNIGASLAPCLGFLNGGSQPTYNSRCCNSVRSLNGSTQTSRAVHLNICRCLQSIAAILKPSPSAVNKLATVCGLVYCRVSLSLVLSLSLRWRNTVGISSHALSLSIVRE